MLDYREFEEDGPLNALVVRDPRVTIKDWYYEESDSAIEAHLAGEYHEWAEKQATRVAAKHYLAKELGREDEEKELAKRLEFLDGLRKEVKNDQSEADHKMRVVHRKYLVKYSEQQNDSAGDTGGGETQKAASKWLELGAISHVEWKSREEYELSRKRNAATLFLLRGRRNPCAEEKMMEAAYDDKKEALWRVLNGLCSERAEATRGVSPDPAVTRELLDKKIQEVGYDIDRVSHDMHHEKIRRGYMQDHPNFGRSAEHQAAMDGGTWLEQEAADRRMSCELRNGVEEGLAAFWEEVWWDRVNSPYNWGNLPPKVLEELQKKDALLHRQHWEQEGTERRMSYELSRDEEKEAARCDAEFWERLADPNSNYYPRGPSGLPLCQIAFEQQRQYRHYQGKERTLCPELCGDSAEELASLSEHEAGKRERSSDEYDASLVNAGESEDAETWDFIEHSAAMAEALPSPGTLPDTTQDWGFDFCFT